MMEHVDSTATLKSLVGDYVDSDEGEDDEEGGAGVDNISGSDEENNAVTTSTKNTPTIEIDSGLTPDPPKPSTTAAERKGEFLGEY